MREAIEHESECAEESRVQHVVQRVRAALREIGEPPRERREPFERLLQILDESMQGTKLAQRRLARAQELRKADYVFVPRLRAVCEIKKISKGKGLLTVLLRGIPTEVAFNDISWILPPPGYEVEWYQE